MTATLLTKPNLKDLPIWLTIFGSVTMLCLGQFQLVDSSVAMLYLNIGGIGLIACLGLSELRRRLGEREIHQLREAATTDALTLVGNRRAFDGELTRRIALFRRHRTTCSLLMIDADHFKAVNDRWGHDVGDLALKSIAKAISATLRDIDLLYRFGGEEFVALLPETRAEEAGIAGERIRRAVNQVRIRIEDQILSFTVSVGCAELNASDNQDSWIKRADEALYSAKKNGRNRVEVGLVLDKACGPSNASLKLQPQEATIEGCSKQPGLQQMLGGIPKQTG
jgi:diguanylate cyclase (GGDEF)-like protein